MQYKIIVDKQSRTNPSPSKKEYIIDIEELRCLGNISDSLVINKEEDYVMRRLELSEYGVLSVLKEEKKELLKDINIELFEGDNYIYLIDMYGNKFYAEYLIKNDFTDTYVTKEELNSSISQTSEKIETSVNRRVEDIEKGVSTVNSRLTQTAEKFETEIKKKVGENEICSKISQSADEILLQGNRVVIESDNFKVTKNGEITATAGKIGGFDIGTTKFFSEISGLYNYSQFDLMACVAYVQNCISYDSILNNVLDANSDNTINSADFLKIIKILNGKDTNTKNVSGKIEINSNNPKNCLQITKDGEIVVSLGLGGINTNLVTTKNLLCGTASSSYTGIAANGDNSELTFLENNNVKTKINNSGITTPTLTQTSKAENKKNFEILTNALKILKEVDIYKYNLKEESDVCKKHIGFVIGDNFNYSKELTNNENNGVEAYTVASFALQCIKEQQGQIEMLLKEIQKLKEGKK